MAKRVTIMTTAYSRSHHPVRTFYLLLSFILWNQFALATLKLTSNYRHIESLINQYTIDVTVLEIASAQDEIYSFELAKKSNCMCIVVLMNGGAGPILQRIKKEHIKNIVVLEPHDFDGPMLNALARCEHMDVTIVHDYFEHFGSLWQSTTDILTRLGTHLFVEIAYDHAPHLFNYHQTSLKMIENRFKQLLFYYETEKKFLEMTRFTQFNKPSNYGSNYEIKSTFSEKLLMKKEPEAVTQWIAGINLITFVMMRGVYPTDDIIRAQIQDFEKAYPYHNDLILGNMIIQGHTIIPIDFDDKRRRANMSNMVRRAVNFFDGSRHRLNNPADKINKHYKKQPQKK